MARIDRRSKKQIEKFIFKRSSPGTGLIKYTVEIKIRDNDILKKLYGKDKITKTFDSLKEAQAFKNKTIPKLAKQAGVSTEYFLNPNKGITVLENVKSSLPAKYKNYISSAELEKILGVGPKALSKQGTGALDTSFTAAVKKLLNQVNAQDIAKGAPKGQPYYMYKNPTKEDLALLKKYTINSNVLEGTGYNYAKAPTVKVVNALRRDPFFKNFIKDNKVITTEMLTDQNSNLNKFLKRNNMNLHQFLNGTLRYAEALKGSFIINLNDPILAENAIKTNKALSSKIYNTLEKSTKGKDMMSPVKTAMYRAAMGDISDQLGNKTTTFENYKNALQKRVRQYGFKTAKDVDEIIGVSASARNQLGPYAVFSRILDEDLNRGILKNYQRALSVRTEKLRNAIAAGNMSEANNIVKKFRNEVYLPNQVKLKQAGQPTNILPELTLSRPTSKTLGGGKGRITALAKQGLDFEDFFQREKFGFKLPKGAITQKELLKQFATKNVNNICQIFGKAEGGRIGFASGGAGCGAEMAKALDEDPIGTANKVKDIKAEGGAVNRVKNAATALLKFAGKGKGFAIGTGIGVGAGALVKKFMNDDPSTYLTNDKQANAMILDTIDQKEREERMEAIGDAPELLDEANIAANIAVTAAPIPGASAVYAARRKPFTRIVDGVAKTRKAMGPARAALGPVGKALSGFATPAGIAALTPLNVASSLYEGDSAYEVATDPLNYLGPALAGNLSKEATRGMGATSKLARSLRLGMSPGAIKMVSRRFGLPGLALSAGISLYELADDYKSSRGMFGKKE